MLCQFRSILYCHVYRILLDEVVSQGFIWLNVDVELSIAVRKQRLPTKLGALFRVDIYNLHDFRRGVGKGVMGSLCWYT